MPASRPGTTPGMALHSPVSGGGAPGDQYSSSSPAAGPQVTQHYGDAGAGAVDASMLSAGVGGRFPSSKGYRANDLLRARTASPQKAGGRAALAVTGKGSGAKADRLLYQAASMSQNQLQSMAPSQPALPEE